MAWLFYIFFIALTVIDLISLINKKNKRDIIVYVIFSLLVLAFAIFYYSDPYRNSLVYYLNKIFHFEGK